MKARTSPGLVALLQARGLSERESVLVVAALVDATCCVGGSSAPEVRVAALNLVREVLRVAIPSEASR